ncbi:uncharacterized protein [Haliotis cracherodii]|uniref:uncharacterized protein n=1 Tax=Haliotis cracherodii TaxID=6455 RepID=UPI0039E84F82
MQGQLLFKVSALLLVALTAQVTPAILPDTTDSAPASSTSPGDIELHGHIKKECTHHSQCSCTGGIAICYEGFCNCIATSLFCFKHSECASRCRPEIGICLGSSCKCYELVEDRVKSQSLALMSNQDDLK